MANGYVRQSAAAIVSGLTITAAAHNNEYNAIQTAFDATTGHTHDGTAGGGAPIALNGSAVTNTLPATKGGTGLSTYTIGDILYCSASNTVSKLAGNTTTTKKFLQQTGDGTDSAAPAWGQPAFTDVTGTATVAQGGTGQTSYTDGQLLIGNTSGNTLSKSTLTAGTGITITNGNGSITLAVTGSTYQPIDADLTALAALSTTGVVKRTGTATFTAAAADLTTDVTGILPSANGGTGNGFFGVTGPTTATKTFTFPNANATVLTDNATVTVAQGGTGQSSYSVGDILYSSASTTLSKLSGNTSTTKKFLSQTGTGTVSAAPTWETIDLDADVTGVLPVANGGTGGTLPVANGGTGGTTAATAMANLGAGRTITSGNGLTGGGDLSADRTLAVGAGTGITVSADAVAIDKATQADMEAQTASKVVTADNMKHHPALPKVWAYFTVVNNVCTLVTSYGVTSVTRSSAGRFIVTFSTAFTDANYALVGSASNSSGGAGRSVMYDDTAGKSSTSMGILVCDSTGNVDPINVGIAIYGDQ